MTTENKTNVVFYNWARRETSKKIGNRTTTLFEINARLNDGKDFRGFQVEVVEDGNPDPLFLSMLYSEKDLSMQVYNAA